MESWRLFTPHIEAYPLSCSDQGGVLSVLRVRLLILLDLWGLKFSEYLEISYNYIAAIGIGAYPLSCSDQGGALQLRTKVSVPQ